MNTISIEQYHEDYNKLLTILSEAYKDEKPHCIIALKRSGFIIGTYLSNYFGVPLYSHTEIRTIPQKYTEVLIVDDKVCTGKSMYKVINKLKRHNPSAYYLTAGLYREGGIGSFSFYVKDYGKIMKMYYEIGHHNLIS